MSWAALFEKTKHKYRLLTLIFEIGCWMLIKQDGGKIPFK